MKLGRLTLALWLFDNVRPAPADPPCPTGSYVAGPGGKCRCGMCMAGRLSVASTGGLWAVPVEGET